MQTLIKDNRESYHYKFFDWVRPGIEKIILDNKLPYDINYIKDNVRISTSWTKGAKSNRIMGSTTVSEVSEKNYTEITISPNYNSDFDYFGTLIHELVHAYCFTNDERGHNKNTFGRLARLLKLKGKLSECGASDEMYELFNINKFIELHGSYHERHAKMYNFKVNKDGFIVDENGNLILDEDGNPKKPKTSAKPKQSARLIKVMCKEHNYIARTSMKNIKDMGCPLCPICKNQMEVEVKL